MTKAFSDVRVVEFAQVISGPFAAAMLGYLGADVIKIEPPGLGDQARHLMDAGPRVGTGMSPLYEGLNPGKRSISLDMKHPRAKEIVHRLVETADVVVENSRVGAVQRMGFGYEDLRKVRPDIVYCSISGYGQEGPRSRDAAYDGAVQAAAGVMAINGEEGGDPMKVGFTVADNSTALTAAFAIASALYRRARTGEGQYLDVSMLDTMLSIMSPVVTSYTIGGMEPSRPGNMSITRQPTGDVFPTADGHLQVNAIQDAQVASFCRIIGLPDLLEDLRFATVQARITNGAALRIEIIAALSHKPAAEWERLLAAEGVPASHVLTLPEALTQPQLEHRDVLINLPARDESEAPTTVVNAGFRAFPDGPGTNTPAPRLGQDTDAVLAELGYSPADIAEFRDARVV